MSIMPMTSCLICSERQCIPNDSVQLVTEVVSITLYTMCSVAANLSPFWPNSDHLRPQALCTYSWDWLESLRQCKQNSFFLDFFKFCFSFIKSSLFSEASSDYDILNYYAALHFPQSLIYHHRRSYLINSRIQLLAGYLFLMQWNVSPLRAGIHVHYISCRISKSYIIALQIIWEIVWNKKLLHASTGNSFSPMFCTVEEEIL